MKSRTSLTGRELFLLLPFFVAFSPFLPFLFSMNKWERDPKWEVWKRERPVSYVRPTCLIHSSWGQFEKKSSIFGHHFFGDTFKFVHEKGWKKKGTSSLFTHFLGFSLHSPTLSLTLSLSLFHSLTHSLTLFMIYLPQVFISSNVQ